MTDITRRSAVSAGLATLAVLAEGASADSQTKAQERKDHVVDGPEMKLL